MNRRPDHYLTVITRCQNQPWLHEFVDYYLSQGVDRIHLLVDGNVADLLPTLGRNPQVKLHTSVNFARDEMVDAKNLYRQIRGESEWFIWIDDDEFVATKKNPRHTIREELINCFNSVDCIEIPWVMMSWNGREQDPQSRLAELIHRWDHDRTHPHPNGWHKGRCRYEQIEIKPIFRGKSFAELDSCHLPGSALQPIVCVESVRGNLAEFDPFYSNLRERDIALAHLVCYHYRIASNADCQRKTTDSKLAAYHTDSADLIACDYPEVVDKTMQEKFLAIDHRRNLP